MANPALPTNDPNCSTPKTAGLYAECIAELESKCGAHGRAAVAVARWGAISVWLMGMGPSVDHGLTNPLPLASKAVYMVSRLDRALLGYPHHAGGAHQSPMDDLPSFAWEGIMQAALETMTDWERAGCPRLDRERVRTVQLYVHAALRNAVERDADAKTPDNGQRGTVESFGDHSATRVASAP